MTQTTATSSLSLNGLRLSVYLGIYPEELTKKQIVTADLHIQFPQPPKACSSDRIEDTFCYDQLIQHLKDKLASRRFQMLEYLSQELYSLLKAYFPPEVALKVKVTKLPQHPDLSQGVTFEYGV